MSRRDVIYLALTVLVVAAVFCIPAPDHNRRAGFDAQRQSTPPDTRYACETPAGARAIRRSARRSATSVEKKLVCA